MTTPRCVSLFVLAAGLSLAALDARAGVARCAAADGVVVYTDKPCADVGGQPSQMSATLLRNLAREAGESADPFGNGATLQLGELRPIAGSADGNRPRSYAGCPRTPQQLETAFQESVAAGDVNELAAIYDWTDVSGRQSRDLLRRLERISKAHTEGAPVSSYAAGGYRRRAGCLLLAL